MSARTLSRLGLVALIAVLLLSAASALTAANTVPVTHAGVDTRSIGPNDLKPSPCAGITLTRLVTSTGTFSGTSANELILAGAGNDNINGGGGNDCILGGGGNDNFREPAGRNSTVCIGGPGNDSQQTPSTCGGGFIQ
jgi:Ca2+-binding RTX toxin-like protein